MTRAIIEAATMRVNEFIEESFDVHMEWLLEVQHEAKKAISSTEITLLPRTPRPIPKRQKIDESTIINASVNIRKSSGRNTSLPPRQRKKRHSRITDKRSEVKSENDTTYIKTGSIVTVKWFDSCDKKNDLSTKLFSEERADNSKYDEVTNTNISDETVILVRRRSSKNLVQNPVCIDKIASLECCNVEHKSNSINNETSSKISNTHLSGEMQKEKNIIADDKDVGDQDNKVGYDGDNKVASDADRKVGSVGGNKIASNVDSKGGSDADNKVGSDADNKVGSDADNKVGTDGDNRVDTDGDNKVVTDGYNKVVTDGDGIDRDNKDANGRDLKDGTGRDNKDGTVGDGKDVSDGDSKDGSDGESKVIRDQESKGGMDRESKVSRDRESKIGRDIGSKIGRDIGSKVSRDRGSKVGRDRESKDGSDGDNEEYHDGDNKNNDGDNEEDSDGDTKNNNVSKSKVKKVAKKKKGMKYERREVIYPPNEKITIQRQQKAAVSKRQRKTREDLFPDGPRRKNKPIEKKNSEVRDRRMKLRKSWENKITGKLEEKRQKQEENKERLRVIEEEKLSKVRLLRQQRLARRLERSRLRQESLSDSKKNETPKRLSGSKKRETMKKRKNNAPLYNPPVVPLVLPEMAYKSYGICDLDSGDDTDPEDKPAKIVPLWAKREALKKQFLRQVDCGINPDDIFINCMKPLLLGTIFDNNRSIYIKRRGSSGYWSTPPVKSLNKLLSKRVQK